MAERRNVIKTSAAIFLCFITCLIAALFTTNYSAAASAAGPFGYALAYKEYVIENYNRYMTLKDPSGNAVEIQNGAFTPLKAGDYSLRDGGTLKIIRVFASVPETFYEYESGFESEYRTGEIVSLPKANVRSAIKSGIKYDVIVEREGIIIDVLKDDKRENYQFTAPGNYSIIYTSEDIFGYISTSVNSFTVVDAPVISFISPEYISFGKTVVTEKIYAYNGEEKVEATLKIYAPSGKEVDTSAGSFEANELGEYRYVVTAEIGGRTISKEYVVKSDVYSSDLFEATMLAKVPVAGTALPAICSSEGSGVLLEAASSGGKFTFANVIDLNSLGRGDNLLSFFPYVTDEIGYTEDLQVILTDIYDKDNSVGIQFKCSPFHDNLTYVTAFHEGRHYAFDNENWVLTGVNGPVKIGDRFFFGGIMRNHYSMQMKSNNPLNIYSFAMDYANREMVLDLTSEGEGRYTLMDFDNPTWCGGTDYVWNGFTTGEVYMTIEFGSVVGKSASIIVTEVCGQRVDGKSVTDVTPPSLNVDVEPEYESAMPYGVVGRPYAIPSVRANDLVSGKINVKTSLKTEEKVIDYNGGEFVPVTAGNYTLDFVAADMRGNSAKKTFVFTVYDVAPEITVRTGDFDKPVPGKYFTIPSFIIDGASGKTEVATEVVYNGKTVVPDSKGKIFTDKTGEIELIAKVKDWLGQEKKQSIKIPVTTDELKIDVKERYGTAQPGMTLSFCDATVYDFSGKGDNEVVQSVFVNGELTDGTYTVKTGDATLKVRYVVACAGKTAEYSYDITVKKSLEDIFFTDGTYSVAGEYNDEVRFSFVKDGSFSLKNAVSHNYLKIGMSTPAYNFDYIDVMLTDAENADVSVFLRIYEYSRTQVRVQLNGKGDYYLLSGSLSANVPFTFFYEPQRKVFKQAVNEKIIFNIDECVNGDEFNGFSGAVYVKVSVSGVKSSSVVRLVGVSNETFVTYLLSGRDSVQPVISVPTDKETVQSDVGETFVIEPTKAYDVIQGYFDVRTTIVSPGGKTILNGKVLKEPYLLKTDEYGTYSVIYETFDNVFVTKTAKTVFVKVTDKIPPVITLNGYYANDAALGDTVTIIGATANDNVDAEASVHIIVYDPQYRNKVVNEGEKYFFALRGSYRIVYLAVDSAGNQTRKVYHVEVK